MPLFALWSVLLALHDALVRSILRSQMPGVGAQRTAMV